MKINNGDRVCVVENGKRKYGYVKSAAEIGVPQSNKEELFVEWDKSYVHLALLQSPFSGTTVKKVRKNARLYIGMRIRANGGKKRAVFRSEDRAPEGYEHVMGPFKTKLAANFMAMHGEQNPHITSVKAAEKYVHSLALMAEDVRNCVDVDMNEEIV